MVPFAVGKDQLEHLFSQCGEVVHAALACDKRWKRQPLALGEFKHRKGAGAALSALRASYKFFASDGYQVATQRASEPPAVGGGSGGAEGEAVPPCPMCEACGQQVRWSACYCRGRGW
eukprot:7740817-Pyramimonas_sp.AAC.1